jgi:hypothetical protein
MKVSDVFYGVLEPARLLTTASNNLMGTNLSESQSCTRNKVNAMRDGLSSVWQQIAYGLPKGFSHAAPSEEHLALEIPIEKIKGYFQDAGITPESLNDVASFISDTDNHGLMPHPNDGHHDWAVERIQDIKNVLVKAPDPDPSGEEFHYKDDTGLVPA